MVENVGVIMQITSEEDVQKALNIIQELKNDIAEYKRNSFKNRLKNAPKMKVPTDWYPARYSSEDCFGIATGLGGKVTTKTLPVVKSWKTSKKTKGTHYVLYEKRTSSFIQIYIKPNDPNFYLVE